MAERWATFDCYGTLVDWETGIGRELARLWPEADIPALRARYQEIEPRVQLAGSIAYRDVLREALVLLAESEGLELPPGEEGALGASLPRWPAFPEVPGELAELRARGWKLVILTNSDPDFIVASIERIGVEFEDAITADRAGSYKPAHGHFERFRELHAPEPGGQVHVAASAFHDLGPAAELGIPAVWINRLGEASEHPRAAELTTLAGLADTLDGLVPP